MPTDAGELVDRVKEEVEIGDQTWHLEARIRYPEPYYNVWVDAKRYGILYHRKDKISILPKRCDRQERLGDIVENRFKKIIGKIKQRQEARNTNITVDVTQE